MTIKGSSIRFRAFLWMTDLWFQYFDVRLRTFIQSFSIVHSFAFAQHLNPLYMLSTTSR